MTRDDMSECSKVNSFGRLSHGGGGEWLFKSDLEW